jgi:hypothetical protein
VHLVAASSALESDIRLQAGLQILRGWGLGAILAIASIAGIALRSIG